MKDMGRTSDARDRLMESAGELLHEKGFNAVGISEICDRAGVNKGSFYYFFPSKRKLALEVVDCWWHQSREFLEQGLLGEEPPLERLRRYFDRLLEHHVAACREHGRQIGCPLGNLALELSAQDSLLRDRLLQAFEGQIGYFERLLREARDRGDLPGGGEPRRLAESLVALIEGKIMLSKMRDDTAPLTDLGDAALRLIGADGR